MYFRLNPECYFIKGSRCGAIYDLIEGNIYALDSEETKLVESCEKNVEKENEILENLKKLCLGNFYEKIVYIEKLRLGSPIEESQPGHPPQFNRAFLEINNSCNRDCWFCGYHGVKRSWGCMGCNKWNEDGETLTTERWKEIIDELKCLNCKDIFITGGDLTLAWDKTMDILDYADGKFERTYITLHEQSFSEKIAKYLTNKAQTIIQTEKLDGIQSEDLIFLLTVRPEEFKNLKDVKNKKAMIDFVSEDFRSLSAEIPLISKRKIPKESMYQFFHNIKYHPCIGNTLAISHTGNVLPCPMMRNHVLGNIRDRELYTIFENGKEEIDKFWNLTLDNIEKCRDCEFRYACNDCRALEEKLTGKLEGKRLCDYEPEEGKWL